MRFAASIRSIHWILSLAKILAIAPVLVGASVFLLWIVTHNDLWLAVGWWVLVTIAVSVVISILLIIYVASQKGERAKKPITKVAIHIVASLILTGLGLAVANFSLTRIDVVVDNQSSIPVTNITLLDNAHQVLVGDVAANSKAVFSFLPKAEGPLHALLTVAGEQCNILVSGYISIDGGSDATITVSPIYEISVHRAIEHSKRGKLE